MIGFPKFNCGNFNWVGCVDIYLNVLLYYGSNLDESLSITYIS